jgi:hypothetical protein
MQQNVDMPTCFIGPPGVGKTALVESIAKELGAHLCVIPLSCYDASELKGIPRVMPLEELQKLHPDRVQKDAKGLVTYYSHNFEFPATNDPDLWIFFFDEFNTVPPSTQVPIFQATQKRCITGSYQFPKNNRIVLAGNRPKDSEAVQPIPSPIISRVNLHEIKFDHREWLEWGQHIHTGIRSFIQNNPDKLCYFTDEIIKNVQPYACPRSWDYASTIVQSYNQAALAEMRHSSEIWSDLETHLIGTLGYEVLTHRDGQSKKLLDYIKEAAARANETDRMDSAKVQRMVQSFEDDKKHKQNLGDNEATRTKAEILRILRALPEIEPKHAAVFFKRIQAHSPHVVTVLKEHKDLVTQLNSIAGLKSNLAALK